MLGQPTPREWRITLAILSAVALAYAAYKIIAQ